VEAETMRIPYAVMQGTFRRILEALGFNPTRAEICAGLFADSSRDGVASHGLNRFPRFVEDIRAGRVNPRAEPVLVQAAGGLERWDGRLGPGNLNACAAVLRAVALAKEHGIGCVALANTNHWMRAGAYGWMAAEVGCAALLWTNTIPNMPPWGAKECKLGNNPFVLALPHGQAPLVFDAAMSMFSYGKLESYARRGQVLPADGGFDSEGRLSRDAAEIMRTKRVLPIGLWKGSGLSLALDLAAMCLSGGDSVRRIGQRDAEYGLSQVFICVDLTSLSGAAETAREMEEVIKDLHAATPAEGGSAPRYPGERVLALREESLHLGIEVDPGYWRIVQDLDESLSGETSKPDR